VMEGSLEWVPAFCANCGRKEGRVVLNDASVFVLCNLCHETHGRVAGQMAMPEEVYYARVAEAQQEKYGRQLSAFEQAKQLTEHDSFLSKLARSRAALTPSL
jgi:cytochrome c553